MESFVLKQATVPWDSEFYNVALNISLAQFAPCSRRFAFVSKFEEDWKSLRKWKGGRLSHWTAANRKERNCHRWLASSRHLSGSPSNTYERGTLMIA